MTALHAKTRFSIREMGYDVLEVDAHIAALNGRIEELEAEPTAPAESAGDLLSDARFKALQLLMSARQDAEAMVDEARAQAAAILAAAGTPAENEPAIPTLEPRLEGIKAELPKGLQRAFVAVAQQRAG